MKRFAALFATLDETRATNQKVAAMRRYFSESAPEDAAWGLYFLRGSRLKRLIAPSRIRVWAAQATALSEAVLDESYAHVGDLAETLALLLDTSGRAHDDDTPLSIWVQRLQALREADETAQRAALLQWWQQLPMLQCFLLNKLLTGELRVGVSAGLATRALAESAALLPALVNERLMGDWQPSAEAFRRVIAPVAMAATAPSDIAPRSAQPYPFCLANPLEADPAGLGAIDEFCVEWKWDGIRCQLIRRAGKTFLWSRGEEMLDGRFPEIEALAERLPDGCVLDGEVLAWREGQVLPFALLQKRIGRKQVGAKLLAEAPVALLAYDLLEWRGVDLREQPLARRRAQLETLAADHGLIVSPRVLAAGWSELAQLREGSRERGFAVSRGPQNRRLVEMENRSADIRWRAGLCAIRPRPPLQSLFGLHSGGVGWRCAGAGRQSLFGPDRCRTDRNGSLDSRAYTREIRPRAQRRTGPGVRDCVRRHRRQFAA